MRQAQAPHPSPRRQRSGSVFGRGGHHYRLSVSHQSILSPIPLQNIGLRAHFNRRSMTRGISDLKRPGWASVFGHSDPLGNGDSALCSASPNMRAALCSRSFRPGRINRETKALPSRACTAKKFIRTNGHRGVDSAGPLRSAHSRSGSPFRDGGYFLMQLLSPRLGGYAPGGARRDLKRRRRERKKLTPAGGQGGKNQTRLTST